MTKEKAQELIENIINDCGALSDVEEWLTELKSSLPWFESSDGMLSIQRHVEARRIWEERLLEYPAGLSRDDLIHFVDRIRSTDGSEAEIDAYIYMVNKNVPHPEIIDLIINDDYQTSEQIVDEALSYRPIVL